MKLDFIGISIIVTIMLGLIIGAVRLNFFHQTEIERLSENLQMYMNNFQISHIGYSSMESLLIYGRILLLMWLLSILPWGFLGSYILLFQRAMAVGFSTALFVSAFGGMGFAMAAALYFFQNLILFPVYGYVLSQSIRNKGRKMSKPLFIGFFALLIAVAFEIFLVSHIINLFL